MSISSIRKTKMPYKGGPGAVGIRFDPVAKHLKYHNGTTEVAIGGYAAGAGGAATQITSIVTAVTLNKPTGTVTTFAASAAAAGEHVFVVNNSLVAATDVVPVVIKSYAGAGVPVVNTTAVAAGSFTITISNLDAAAALNAALAINFMVLKGAAS